MATATRSHEKDPASIHRDHWFRLRLRVEKGQGLLDQTSLIKAAHEKFELVKELMSTVQAVTATQFTVDWPSGAARAGTAANVRLWASLLRPRAPSRLCAKSSPNDYN